MIRVAQSVTEAVMHPASQVVSNLVLSVVRQIARELKFAMSADEATNPVPDQWEK